VPEIVVDDVLVVMCDPAAILSVVEASDAEATVVKDSVHVSNVPVLGLSGDCC